MGEEAVQAEKGGGGGFWVGNKGRKRGNLGREALARSHVIWADCCAPSIQTGAEIGGVLSGEASHSPTLLKHTRIHFPTILALSDAL